MPDYARSARLGCLLIALSTLCWSLNAPLVKYLSDVPALMITAMRSSFGGLLLLPFLLRGGIPRSRWTLLYLAGYCGVCTAVVAALHLTNSAIAVGMQFCAMVWLIVLSAFRRGTLRGEPWRPGLVVFTGLVLFMLSGTGETTMLGNLLALSESFFLAMLTIGSRHAGGSNPLGLTCLGNLILGSLLLIVVPGSCASVAAFLPRDWIVFILLGIFPVAMGYGFYNLSLRHISGQTASLLGSSEMIIAPLWVWLFVGEENPPLVIAGLAFIFAGVVWCGLSSVLEGRKTR